MTARTIQEWEERLPALPKPVANYVPAVQVRDVVFTSGMIPMEDGALKYRGKVGSDLTVEQGYEAAALCTLNGLSAISSLVGGLERIEGIVQVNGYVASAPGFQDQPRVLNGASDLLGEIFGEMGRPARMAIGVSELPMGAPVELSLIAKLKGFIL